MGTPLVCSKDISRWTGACGGWAPPQGKLAQGGAVGGGWPQPAAWWMGPSHMLGGGECRFSGGVPLPIFALRGTWRAREYSAEATDLAQHFLTHTESAAKTSSPSQPSPAHPSRLWKNRAAPNPALSPGAALPSQSSPGPVSLGPPPGTPLTCPLPLTVLPDQRHCQPTHPRPPPGLALASPHTSTCLGDTCSSRTSTTHAPGLKLNSLGLPWRSRA